MENLLVFLGFFTLCASLAVGIIVVTMMLVYLADKNDAKQR